MGACCSSNKEAEAQDISLNFNEKGLTNVPGTLPVALLLLTGWNDRERLKDGFITETLFKQE